MRTQEWNGQVTSLPMMNEYPGNTRSSHISMPTISSNRIIRRLNSDKYKSHPWIGKLCNTIYYNVAPSWLTTMICLTATKLLILIPPYCIWRLFISSHVINSIFYCPWRFLKVLSSTIALGALPFTELRPLIAFTFVVYPSPDFAITRPFAWISFQWKSPIFPLYISNFAATMFHSLLINLPAPYYKLIRYNPPNISM